MDAKKDPPSSSKKSYAKSPARPRNMNPEERQKGNKDSPSGPPSATRRGGSSSGSGTGRGGSKTQTTRPKPKTLSSQSQSRDRDQPRDRRSENRGDTRDRERGGSSDRTGGGGGSSGGGGGGGSGSDRSGSERGTGDRRDRDRSSGGGGERRGRDWDGPPRRGRGRGRGGTSRDRGDQGRDRDGSYERRNERTDKSSTQVESEPEDDLSRDSKPGTRHKFHPLEHPWTFWYSFWFDKRIRMRKTGPPGTTTAPVPVEDYQSNLKQVGSFTTVEGFWRLFHHMLSASQLDVNCNYHLFKKSIKPMWEDPANHNGGKWTIRIPSRERHNLNLYWRNVVLALIGETLDSEDEEEICGAVLSRRRGGDRISIWTKRLDKSQIQRLGERLKDSAVQDIVAAPAPTTGTQPPISVGAASPTAPRLDYSYDYHVDSINHANAGPIAPGQPGAPGAATSTSTTPSTTSTTTSTPSTTLATVTTTAPTVSTTLPAAATTTASPSPRKKTGRGGKD